MDENGPVGLVGDRMGDTQGVRLARLHRLHDDGVVDAVQFRELRTMILSQAAS